MITRTFKTTIHRDGSMCFIPITFDPRAVFGKVRAPVKVTLNGYSFRSTIAAMGEALKAAPPAWSRWQELSFTHRREHGEAVEGAKKPETRARRLQSAVCMIKARPANKTGHVDDNRTPGRSMKCRALGGRTQ